MSHITLKCKNKECAKQFTVRLGGTKTPIPVKTITNFKASCPHCGNTETSIMIFDVNGEWDDNSKPKLPEAKRSSLDQMMEFIKTHPERKNKDEQDNTKI